MTEPPNHVTEFRAWLMARRGRMAFLARFLGCSRSQIYKLSTGKNVRSALAFAAAVEFVSRTGYKTPPAP
jgi:hypothetical protein